MLHLEKTNLKKPNGKNKSKKMILFIPQNNQENEKS